MAPGVPYPPSDKKKGNGNGNEDKNILHGFPSKGRN
jgi:hypothetical protein